MRASMILGLLALAALPGAAAAEGALDWLPHIEGGLGHTGESLTVPSGEATSLTETRALYSTRLVVGLAYGPFDGLGFGGGAVRGRTALGADILLGPGRWGLLVEQDLRWHRPLGPLVLAAGPGLAGRIDLERPALSSVAIGVPIGLRWGLVELDWRPAWRLPLADEQAAVFGGTRRHGASSGVEWLALSLRVHLTGLAW